MSSFSCAFDIAHVLAPTPLTPNIVLVDLDNGVLGYLLAAGALVTYAGRQRDPTASLF
jgi:hypothetical protein